MRLATLILVCLCAHAECVQAAEIKLESAGARYGLSAHRSSNRFGQLEGYIDLKLPWHRNFRTNWSVYPRLDLSAGSLYGRGESGFVGSVGPSLALERKGLPLVFSLGLSPTVLGQDTYRDKHFGTPLQFTSHAGLDWRLGAHVNLGFRFQHMSNASLSSHNPGLNLHMFSIGYRY